MLQPLLLFTYFQKNPHCSGEFYFYPFCPFLHCFPPWLASCAHPFTPFCLISPLEALFSDSGRAETSLLCHSSLPRQGAESCSGARGCRGAAPRPGHPISTSCTFSLAAQAAAATSPKRAGPAAAGEGRRDWVRGAPAGLKGSGQTGKCHGKCQSPAEPRPCRPCSVPACSPCSPCAW